MTARLSLVFTLSAVACAANAPQATGELAQWIAGPPLPTPRANHCSAAIDNWVLVIGGNHASGADFVKTDEIHAAQIGVDGTLGPWQLAGHTASPVTECNATSDGRHLYVVDGIYDVDTDGSKVFTADLDATGMLGTLTSMGALPDGVRAISSEAAVRDQQLLVMHTDIPMGTDQGATKTLRTPLANMTWATSDWGIGFRSQSEFAFGDKFAYTIGGYHDPAVGALADVYVAPIAGGAAVASTPLPAPVGWGEASVVDDWLFVVGGRAQTFGGSVSTAVYAAQLAADGTVGAWQTPTALPMPRTNHKLTLVGDYLVVTGGAASGPGDDKVFVAQVRYPQ